MGGHTIDETYGDFCPTIGNSRKGTSIQEGRLHGTLITPVSTMSRYVCMLYVCMYVCIYVCMLVCMYVRMYVCMFVCLHVYMYVYMYVCNIKDTVEHMFINTYILAYTYSDRQCTADDVALGEL